MTADSKVDSLPLDHGFFTCLSSTAISRSSVSSLSYPLLVSPSLGCTHYAFCGDLLRTVQWHLGSLEIHTCRLVLWQGFTSQLHRQWCWCNQRSYEAAPLVRDTAVISRLGNSSLRKHAGSVLELVLSGGVLPNSMYGQGHNLSELCQGVCGKSRLGIQWRIKYSSFRGAVTKWLLPDFSPVDQGDKE